MVRGILCRSTFGLALLGAGLLADCAPQQTVASAPTAVADQSATPFRIRGLSVVDVGASRISGTGRVQNLHNLADFSGNYVSATAGATVAGGAAASAMRNQNGVVIEGISTSQGARLTLAPGGVDITLTEQ